MKSLAETVASLSEVRCAVCGKSEQALALDIRLGPVTARWWRPPPGWWLLRGCDGSDDERPHARCEGCLS